MNSSAAILTQWTPQRRVAAGESKGRPRGRLPGSYIHDRVGLRQGVALCRSCVRKFNAESVDYVTKKNLPVVMGRCDGCQEHSLQNHLFVHQSLASNL